MKKPELLIHAIAIALCAVSLPLFAQAPSVVYVSPDGAAIAPYDSPEKAATSIQAAVDAVGGTDEAPGEVRIAPGVYSETEGKTSKELSPMVRVEKPLRLVGLGASREEVVLDAQSKCQVLYMDHPKAVAANLTLANGNFSAFIRKESSGNLILKDGFVTNCLVRNGYGYACGLAHAVKGRITGCDFTLGDLNESGPDRPSAGLNLYGPVQVDRCRFYDNDGGYGAALYLDGSASGAVVRRCEIFNNIDRGNGGGGVAIVAGLVEQCVITNNVSAKNGGGVTIVGAGAVVRNCLIADNEANGGSYGFGYSDSGSGGGVSIQAGLLDHCTLYGNRVQTFAGKELYQTGGEVRNTIIASPSAVAPDTSIHQTGGTLSHCRVPVEGLLGDGNITADPLFVDIEGGDMRLTFASPCIDIALADETVTEDLSGVARPTGAGSDLGCYEWVSGGNELLVSFTATMTGTGEQQEATFTAKTANGVEPIEYAWDFGDGTTGVTTTPSVTHLFGPGAYTIALAVTDGEGKSARVVRERLVTVNTRVAYVSTNGTAVWPYDTPEKAAGRIQDAVDAVRATDEAQGEIRVAPGVYSDVNGNESKVYSPMVAISKNVRLVGLGASRDEVVLDAQKKRQVLFLSHPKAIVENVTLTRGRYDAFLVPGASGNLLLHGGMVTNCVISDGYGMTCGNVTAWGGTIADCEIKGGSLAVSGSDRPSAGVNVYGPVLVEGCSLHDNSGGYGAAIYINKKGSAAVVRDCVIFNNKDSGNGGGGVTLNAGLLDRCVITNNVSLKNGGGVVLSGGSARMRNCLVAGNISRGTSYGFGYSKSGGGGGVALSAGTVEHCTIAGNEAATQAGFDLYQKGGTVINSVVFSGSRAPEVVVYKTGGTISHSVVPVAGLGDDTAIVGDPLFESPSESRFEPLYGSPCIDAALAGPEVTVDLLGRGRPAGAGPDIGCYEVDFSQRLVASFAADSNVGVDALDVVFTAETVNGQDPMTYVWDFGDGTTETTTVPTTSHSFGYGLYTVELTVRDGAGQTATVTRPGYISVSASTVHVSETGSATWPYESWEKATPCLQDAIDAVHATDAKPGVVRIAPGRYLTRTKDDAFLATVLKPVRLIGPVVGGEAVLDAAGERRILHLNHPKASCANVVCANGGNYNDSGYGPGIWISAGVASNLVVRGCVGYSAPVTILEGALFTDGVISNCPNYTHSGPDRLGGGAYLFGGTLQRTTVTNCCNGAGGAVYLAGATAVVRDCRLLGCDNYRRAPVYVERGLVERCLIAWNRNSDSWSDVRQESAVYAVGTGATVRNCVIVGNTAVQKSGLQSAAFVTSGATFLNNTVQGNRHATTLAADGIVNDGGVVANSIAEALETTGEGVSMANCIGIDPLFRDPARGDYSIRTSSPCLNAGENSFWLDAADPVDYAGKPRIRLGKVDIGAYEFDGALGTFLLIR